MDPVWRPLIATILLRFATGVLVITLKDFMWKGVGLYRDEKKHNDIYRHLMKLDAAYHDKQHPSDTLEAVKLGSQITNALDFLAFDAVPKIITLVGAAIHLLSSYGQRVALVLLYVMLFYILYSVRSIKVTMPRLDQCRAAKQKQEQHFNDGVRGWATVARHNQAGTEAESYERESSALKQQRYSLFYIEQALDCCINLFMHCGYWAAMFLVVTQSVFSGSASAGNLVAFNGYWYLLLSPLLSIIDIPRKLIEDVYAAARLRRILATKPTVEEGSKELEPHQQEVVFHKVTIEVDGKIVSKGLNLQFPAGETTALIGPSGVGKSSILDSIIRMRDVAAGCITIGGTNIAELTQAS
ncbi:hypothetical protein RB593_001598 [Gaeumannomyces tritici]